MGDNPIDHRVDRVNFTITNTTLPGHDFYPGTVVHSLSMDATSQWSWSNFSFQSVQVINLTTVGTGTGPYGWFNNMVGPVLFNSTHRNSRNELQRQAR